ncbi:zinc finger protein ADR1 [Colletotrichum camelliae]|nr:zinc finger protein ADR1 [Colletotrichum camelliae]
MLQSSLLALAVLAVVPIATAAPRVDISKTNALLTSPPSSLSHDLFSFESWIDGISSNPNGTHLSSDEAIAAAIRTPMSRGKGVEQPDLQRRNSSVLNVFRRSLLQIRKVVRRTKPGEKGLKTDEASTVGIGLEGVQCNTYPRQLSLVETDWREIRRTWVMQAWLLHIIYGAFTGNATHFDKAKKMLRWVVDAARDLGLLRQSVFTSTTRFHDGEEQTLHDHWMSYVESESMKLCMYTILFLDSHIFSPCNIRPLTTPIELDWELPLPGALWEADTSLSWAQRLGDEPRTLYLTRSGDASGIPCPTTKSLNLAIQSLMTDTPSPQLLAALKASTMAAIFILTSLESLVREFTRCYYQMPPALADPNAFHILTQSQNRQVSAALRYAAEIITAQLAQANSSNWHILKFADRIALSVKLALCKPDDLLIGGIVENSVVAGLTTATHLTLGLQVGARRSLQNLLRYNSGDDGMLVFLDDLMDVLSSVTSLDKQDPLREVPWATVATYRILLAIWRLLRWATGEMRRKAGSQTTVRSRFEASTIVFNSILEVISPPEELESQTRHLSRPARETTTLGITSDDSEARFMETVLQFWKDRPVWSMGSFMTTVLEEIISAGGMAYELRGAE